MHHWAGRGLVFSKVRGRPSAILASWECTVRSSGCGLVMLEREMVWMGIGKERFAVRHAEWRKRSVWRGEGIGWW